MLRPTLFGLLLAGCSTTPPEGAPQPPPPAEPEPTWSLPEREVTDVALGRTHVIVVVIDTLRADHLGAWGYPHGTSPHLDALAAEGVRFASTYAASSWTRPGMAALTTGRYAREVGIYEERFDQLPEQAVTLAERLDEHGYVTLGSTANPNINSWFGFSQGFDEWSDAGVIFKVMREREGFKRFTGKGEGDLETASDVTNRALMLVDEHQGELAEAPLYLQVLYIDPHIPHHPEDADKELMERAGSEYASYDAEIMDADRHIQRLLDGLEQRGILQDALVVVTADHGEGLDSHPGQAKSYTHGYYLYDSTLHIPWLLHHPSLAKGHVVDDLVSQIDIAPTVLDLLGMEIAPDDFSGRSMAAGARGEPLPAPREAVFAETEWRLQNKDAVRTASHKLVRNHDAALFQQEGAHEGTPEEFEGAVKRMLSRLPAAELYTSLDPMKETTRSRIEDAPAQAELEALLERWTEQTSRIDPIGRDPDDCITLADGTKVPTDFSGGKVELDGETTDMLKALGYMD